VAKLNSFRELRVYQELRRLHLLVHENSLAFPKFEMYELGSQIRRSSNAAPAILAEGWGSRHTNIYMESINRAKGEIRETQHHIDMAHAKEYLHEDQWVELDAAYESCDKMLESLYQSLSEWRGSTRNPDGVREDSCAYGSKSATPEWDSVSSITYEVLNSFPPQPSTLNPQPSTLTQENP